MDIVDWSAHREYARRLAETVTRGETRVGETQSAAIRAEVDRRLARERGEEFAATMARYVPLDGRRMLDIGAGFGELIFACATRGAEVYGVEPDDSAAEVCRLLFASYGRPSPVQRTTGEALPFEDASFDVVTAQHVLEHVRDLDAVISEMVRVTRPGGVLYVSVPNYLFPYEGHYKMKWVPLTPKPIGALVLKLRGKDPTALLNEINYTTYPGMVRRWRRHGLHIRNITRERLLGGEEVTALYRRPLVRVLAVHLRLFPTVTWLLSKPSP